MTAEETLTKGTPTVSDDIHWTLLDLAELVDIYWEVIAPAFEQAGHDSKTERPTHAWLSANSFRGLVYALREYHDRTFGEFWADDLRLAADEGYEWGIKHERTITLLEAYLDSRRERGNLSASSVDTLRYRLATYVRAYAHGKSPHSIAPSSFSTEMAVYTCSSMGVKIDPERCRSSSERKWPRPGYKNSTSRLPETAISSPPNDPSPATSPDGRCSTDSMHLSTGLHSPSRSADRSRSPNGSALLV